MDNFTLRFLTEWRKLGLPFENETLVAAVSGGADSISLLLVISELRKREKLKNRFVIAHFNHNLRGAESEADAEFVKDLCVKFDFEFASGSGDISRKGNIEQNARSARYDFLQNIAENTHSGAILTAHTMNDQAETFMLNLLRGSGIRGLSGMKAIMNYELRITNYDEAEDSEFKAEISKSQIANRKSQIALVRPLLNWAKRKDTENYCQLCQINPRFDAMNDDLNFKRVRIRKVLLPMMKEFNPKIIETLANTAGLLRLELDDEGKGEEKKRRGEEELNYSSPEISLQKLKNLSQSAFYNFLRGWIEFNRGNLRGLNLKHFEAIERLVYSRKSGKIIELPNGNQIIKEKGKLLFAGETDIL